VASGVKVLVLAVIVGIGTMLFNEFTKGFGGNQPTLDDALSMVLASLSLLGLGIFGPGIATGLTAGAPQLGAGAAVGTVIVKETTNTGAIVAHDLKLCPIVMDVLAKIPAERRVGPLIRDGGLPSRVSRHPG
jgi:type IV secretory pathway TrbL component